MSDIKRKLRNIGIGKNFIINEVKKGEELQVHGEINTSDFEDKMVRIMERKKDLGEEGYLRKVVERIQTVVPEEDYILELKRGDVSYIMICDESPKIYKKRDDGALGNGVYVMEITLNQE